MSAEQGRAVAVCAAVVMVFHLADWMAADRRYLWVALSLRVVWAGLLLVAAATTSPQRRGWSALAIRVASIASAICYVGIVVATGGPRSPLFEWSLALPLAIPLLTRDQLGATLIAGALLAAGTTTLLVMAGAPSLRITSWLLLSSCSMIISAVSCRAYVRANAAERALTEARLQQLRQTAELERERGHADRLAILGKLAAGVAHEVNNPLAFITANVDFLRDRCNDAGIPECEEIFADVRTGLERIGRIVGDLRTFARSGEDGVESLQPAHLVDEALRIASPRLSRVRVQVQLTKLPPLRGNRTRLVQVLVNLLFNAADAFGKGPGAVTVRGERAGAAIRLLIEDDGPGIPAHVLPRLFEPFVTTKPAGQGTGLGLAVSRDYVERSGGKLSAGNRIGGGAQFVIECPVWEI